MIIVDCSSCGSRLRVSDDKAGRRGKCPKCQAILTIPLQSQEPIQTIALADVESDPPPAEQSREYSSPAPSGEGCPSCDGPLPAKARICAQCGIYLPSGRPVLTAHALDEDMLEVRGSKILKIISWIIPWGIYPVYSEAGGRHRPYATWAIAALTILVSVWFWCYSLSDAPAKSQANLMLWPRHMKVEVEKPEITIPPGALSKEQSDALMKKIRENPPKPGAKDAVVLLTDEEELPEPLGEFHWYQLFTHQLLHGGLMHLAGNLLFLMIFGTRINAVVGQLPMLLLYPLLGVAASFDSLFTANAAPIPTIGASGAIMGLAGMYLVLFPLHRLYMAGWWRWGLLVGFKLSYRFFAVRGFWVLLCYIGLDILMASLRAQDGVAHWAHIGGFIGGIVLAMILLTARQIYSGGDLLSLCLGQYAWALIGTPHRHWSKGRKTPGQPVATPAAMTARR